MKRAVRHGSSPGRGEYVEVDLGDSRDGYSVIVIDNATGRPVLAEGAAGRVGPESPLFKRAVLEVERGMNEGGEIAYAIAANEAAVAAVVDAEKYMRRSAGGSESGNTRRSKVEKRDALICELHAAGASIADIVKALDKADFHGGKTNEQVPDSTIRYVIKREQRLRALRGQ